MIRIYLKSNQIFYGTKSNDSKPLECLLKKDISEWLKEIIQKDYEFSYYFQTLNSETGQIGRKSFTNMQIIIPYIDFKSTSNALLFKMRWM